MWAAIFCTVGLRTAFSFLLGIHFGMGVTGVAIAMGIDWAVKATLNLLRWRSGKWKTFKVI